MKKFLFENGRPEKPVACPRCNSLNTKFCYFNNYNEKQPRHFCRECQRYWTAGGSLRNVPVGAGRRKHKISSSKSYGNTSTNSEVNECTYASLKPYHALPFKQLVACSPDGIVQEIQSFKELGHDDVMSMYGSERPRLPQTVPKLVTDATPDSKFSLGMKSSTLTFTQYDTNAAEKLGFLQRTQKRARDLTLDTKFSKAKHVHEFGNPTFTSTHGHDGAHDDGDDGAHDDGHDRDAQHSMHDRAHDDVHHDIEESANDDAVDKDACVGNGHELPPLHCGTTQDLPVSCHMAEHDDSTCCSSVTTAITSSSSEGVSETNGSSPTTHTLTSMTNSTGLENPQAIWGPLMWPWLWPFFLNRANGAPGMPQVDPTLALGLGAVASTGVPQVDSTSTPGITAESAHNDPACTPTVGPSFLHWPYMWNPLAWGSPWNVAWNGASITSNQQFQDPAKEKQGSLCVPKTLRMDPPNEATYRSILSTLGVATPPHSPASYFNAFQPKADVFQPKTTAPQAPEVHSELHGQSSPHVNSAAQARSIAFQEGG